MSLVREKKHESQRARDMAIVSRGLAALMNASTLFLDTHCEVSRHSCVLQDPPAYYKTVDGMLRCFAPTLRRSVGAEQ